MPIYDVEGNELNSVNNISGSEIDVVYDIQGNEILLSYDELIVMTYNVQWWSNLNSNEQMQSNIINTYHPDIIGFQEFSRSKSVPTIGQNVLGDYSEIELSNHYNYNAMASKVQLNNITIQDFTNQDQYDIDTYNETRCYMKAYFTVGGKTICWINTHLCYHTDASQYAQMAEIFAMAEQEEYVIITCDANSYGLTLDSADYIGLFKPFVDAGYNLANSTEQRGFIKTWGGRVTSMSNMRYPCDNIITSSNIVMKSVYYDETKFNYTDGTQDIDHIPVIAYLAIQ